MVLAALIKNVQILELIGELDILVSGINFDSRKVCAGELFIAIKGSTSDGHQYITGAIESGAKAILCQDLPAELIKDITYVQVQDCSKALGYIATMWNDEPSKKLKLVGVTGTNGKTTTATLLYNLFRSLGHNVGLLSTVVNLINERQIPATHTTPDQIALNALLKEMVDAGCEYAFMEVSSHSVDQNRIAGLEFDGGVFTNLTRDHMDYHLTVEAYLKAKKGFFDALPSSAFALTNIDDRNGMVMLQNTKAKKCSYSLRTLADYKARIIEEYFDGMLLDINSKEVFVQFVGRFNAYNLLAVFGAAMELGANPEDALLILSQLKPVAGRFESFRSKSGFSVIVDYAHTPDALNNVLEAISEILKDNGRLIAIVGAGGNRDKGKRPLMAQEAANKSDQVILTSDNPRFEEPVDIINDMLAGLNAEQKKRTLAITDRKEAIKTAFLLAKPNDVILIAGKGHEDYQEIKGVKYHFDDREIVRELLSEN